jgi:hypothetical protein
MGFKLVIEHQDYNFYLAWADEDGTGAFLGQDQSDGTGEAPEDRDAYEHWLACKMCRDMEAEWDRRWGFHWESESGAKKARAAINTALKQGRDLPEWAKTALAAGWKPPKGWKA